MKDLPEQVDGFYPKSLNQDQRKLIKFDGRSEPELLKEAIGAVEFSSTKGHQVIGNEKGESAFRKERQPRQVLKRKQLYDIPLTKQELDEKLTKQNNQMQL